jgi:hypothetical protein
MTSVFATRNPSEPVKVGETVRATAVGQGGVTPYQFKYVLKNPSSGPTVRVREWSTDATFETQLPVEGTFTYEVWGRSAGVTGDTPQVKADLVVTALASPPPNPVQSVSVSSDVGSPRPAQQTVRFTAGSFGGVQPVQYKWVINGAVAQNWSTTNTYPWTPSTAGTYSISIWARSAGATADIAEASNSFTFRITEPEALWMTGVRFGTVTQSKSAAGTTMSLTWSGQGGVPPYEYRVEHRHESGTFQLVRDWSSATSIDRTVTVAGTHYVRVSGRSAGSTSATGEANNTYSTLIQEPVFAAPPTSVTLTASKPSPQRVGTEIELNAVAAGTATYEYKYQYQLGTGTVTTWPGWGSAGRDSWTPSVAGTYTITVFARQYRAGESAPQVSKSIVFVVSP